ncbi:MAG: hypothetical protein HYZ53_13375 [Planctomycetes bacterium]|nr:hypothetical protein [Planctomycetota bacterium]
MGFKSGTPLRSIAGVDPRLLTQLRDEHGITTAEELVEAVAHSKDLEPRIAERLGDRESFPRAYGRVCDHLGPERVKELQAFNQEFATGALPPTRRKP